MGVNMDGRVERITYEVRKYDPRLYAVRASNGMIQIHRKADRLEASDFNQSAPHLAHLNPQFILALTDTWTLQGRPVEWGLEPVMTMLRDMDSWRDDSQLEQVTKNREAEKVRKDKANKDDLRDMALEMRRDFAKATNDINTSTL